MDRSKAGGHFATAYKLTRSTVDSKQRLHRRSLEWKEIRRDQADKRRNLSNDLSPVVEGDTSQQHQSKSYQGKTPTKRPGNSKASTTGSDKKVNDRLEMLKKWKAEKEQKKKEEQIAKKSTVFRVSKNVDHKDAFSLYKKQQSGKIPVKPNVPTTRQPVSTRKATETTKATSSKSIAKTNTTTDKAQSKAAQSHGGQKGPTKTTMVKTHSPRAGALKKARSPKSLKKAHSPKASTRGRLTRTSTNQAGAKAKSPPPTRTLRSRTNSKPVTRARQTETKVERVTKNEELNATGLRAEESMSVETEVTQVPAANSVNLSKVTTREPLGPMDSFAPGDCTFSAPASVTSFVFKPLSPASAATFLFPNQDSSACASFLETKPNRASTPKSADKEKDTKSEVPIAEKAEEQETVIEKKDLMQTATPNAETETVGASDEVEKELVEEGKEKDSPVKTKRSTRRSLNHTGDSSSENEVISKPPTVTPARTGRRTRRSVLPAVSETDTNSEGEVLETEQNIIETPSQSTKRPRRSLRRSAIKISETDTTESVQEDAGIPAKRRRTSRRSVSTAQNPDTNDSEDLSTDDVDRLSRSLRRSARNSSVSQVFTEEANADKNEPMDTGVEEQNEKVTPARSARRSMRRSKITQMLDDSVFTEEKKQIETEELSNISVVSTPAASEAHSAKEVKSEKRSARAKFIESVSENKTPARQKGRAARRSFAGFAMPNSNSCVLSAKRKARKSMMPKSPEEWVDLLSHSPMVEMTRRTPKAAATKSATVSVPPLNFDDIDIDNLPPLPPATADELNETDANTRQETSILTSNLTQPMETLTLGVGETNMMASPAVAASASPVKVSQSVGDEAGSRALATSQNQDAIKGPTSPVLGTRSSAGDKDNLQVEEISSTVLTEDYLSDEILGIKHFRDLLLSERTRLRGLCAWWDDYNDNTTELSEEIRGQIRTVIGQAVLLMSERFKQFSGLVDNCEFKTGEKETTVTDLQGFWDMIYFQVEDVIAKFDRLEKLKNNNWVEDKPKPVVKKVVKKKISKPSAPNVKGKSKFAAFRAQMKKQQETEGPGSPLKTEEKVFEVPGFFTVASPVRSPKPHCEGGTPKKKTPVSELTPVSADSAQNSLKVPSEQLEGSGGLLNRTPARKSYLPVIPSPLLKDTTPVPRPVRSCTKKTPIPKRLLEQTEPLIVDEVESTTMTVTEEKKTPKRRSLRPRKSVTFDKHVRSETQDSPVPAGTESPVVERNDAEFERLLQPITVQEESSIANEADESFSKYLRPGRSLDTSVEKENTPKQSGRRRRSSLKTTKSSEKRRSRGHVHFISPLNEHGPSVSLPHTPYNRDSLVKQKRVTRRSATKSDVFDIDNIDDEDALSSLPSPFSRSSKRSGRPSLLYTPPKTQTRTPLNKDVPTATLISFSP